MALVKVFPVLHGDLLLQILKHRVSLFESRKDLNISCSAFDVLESLLELESGTIHLKDLSLDKFLFLEMDNGSFLLASLD